MRTVSHLLFFLVLLGALFGAAPAVWASPDGAALVDVTEVVTAVDSGSAIAIVAACIMVVVNLFKAPWMGGLVKKIPARWRVVVPIALGAIAGILSDVMLGMSWGHALMIGLFSGPTAVFAHEAVVEALLGGAKSREPAVPNRTPTIPG